MRFDFQSLDELSRQLAAALPDELQTVRAELKEQFRSILLASMQRMELVTREELDSQKKVLERTREKLEILEKRLDQAD